MNNEISKISAQILEKNISKPRGELVRYSTQNVSNMDTAQDRLARFGKMVGERMVDLVYLREKPQKRDNRLLSALTFLKSTFWKSLFGKEADELERCSVTGNRYYMIEHEPLVNKYTRFVHEVKEEDRRRPTPLNMASFNAGVVESFLCTIGFPCTVSATWHKGTTYAITFDDSVIAREKKLENR